MDLVPLRVEHLWDIPRQCLKFSVEVEYGELNSLSAGVEPHSELWAALGVGDPDEVPWLPPGPPVPECCDKAELLGQALVEHPQCVHPQVGRRVNPVCRLHLVRASHPEQNM